MCKIIDKWINEYKYLNLNKYYKKISKYLSIINLINFICINLKF